MNEQVQAVELLQSRLRTLGLHLDALTDEFNQEVEATIKRNKRSKGKPSIAMASWDEMLKYKENLRDELRGAIVLGVEYGIELTVCRKLAVALDGASDPFPFAFDAVVELEQLIEKLLGRNNTPESDDEKKYRQAVERWNANATGDSWANIAEDLVNDREGWKAFSQAVKRYAAKCNIVLRSGKPGSKRIASNRNE